MKNEKFTLQGTMTVEMESRNFYVGVSVREVMRNVNALQVTREQFAKMMTEKMPWAFIHVGGRHVAIHNKRDGERDALITSINSDWN